MVVAKEDSGLSHLPARQSSFVEDIGARNNCTLDSLYVSLCIGYSMIIMIVKFLTIV